MTDTLSPSDRAKQAAAAHAVTFVRDGMKLGLGTGSTARFFVDLVADRASAEDWTLSCVPTSSVTRDQALARGLRVVTLDEAGALDLTVDGADEFDPSLSLIKGGGAALLQEKIVASASERMIVISDASKEVDVLGAFPLPVEIVRFGHGTTAVKVRACLTALDLDGAITLRMAGDAPLVTDEGHYILDLSLGQIVDPAGLDVALNTIPGVVESGLFCAIASMVIIGETDGSTRTLGL